MGLEEGMTWPTLYLLFLFNAMTILNKYLPFVNEQIAFHKKAMEKFGQNTFRANLHKTTAEKFASLAADLEIADNLITATPLPESEVRPKGPIQLSLTIEDIEGLPDELVRELSLSDGDKTEFAVVNAIEEAGGIISLDKLLIALYKKTGEIHRRNLLISRLARMAGKGTIYYVPGRKGVYSTDQLSNEQAARLFGSLREEVSQVSRDGSELV